MPPRDWAFRIQDILEAIAKIQRSVSAMDFDTFESDEDIMDAVAHNLTVIGEAANHIPSDIKDHHPEIPWRQWSISGTSPSTPTGTFALP